MIKYITEKDLAAIGILLALTKKILHVIARLNKTDGTSNLGKLLFSLLETIYMLSNIKLLLIMLVHIIFTRNCIL